MFRFFTSNGSKFNEQAAEIEKYRARHRQLCRNQQPDATRSTHVEDLDVEDGRTRKISAKWRQEHEHEQQFPVGNQLDAEMHMSSNAFDFSTSPEAFYETEQQQQQLESKGPSCQNNQQSEEQTRKRNANGSLWERRSLVRPTSGSARQVPTLGKEALWGSPMHYVTQDAQRQALYFQPQYYA
ncbi:hypothetical protein KXD40_001001 [Peronospora effusa]|uniref:Uncharacterized protein n=1 Tax=Peronospora effusa TaxID=542832 RepID=A0A425CPG0_9STRA|nr:hypothetical protein DD237_007608 [Peronospora effusa]UIZ20466.1 hypothetical protein KXD40_001001 [Peronospora effusa]CAI5724295.1 unnamed protein product [Peronospora effusa]